MLSVWGCWSEAVFGRTEAAPHQRRFIAGRPKCVTLRAPRLIGHFARPAFTHLEGLFEMLDRLAFAGRAHQFPEASSFSIALLNFATASSCFSRAFSIPSSFGRFAALQHLQHHAQPFPAW